MKNWLSKNLNTIIIGSFLIPIFLVAFVSISHVITFYTLANPISWATYLSIAVEIAALAALAGVSAKFGKFIYIPFGIVTFIQLLGNFFFSYTWINVESKEFKDWMDMISPLLEPLGVEANDATSHRRILAFFTGGLLPFISLTFAHMLIVYANRVKGDIEESTKEEKTTSTDIQKELITEENIDEISTEAGKIEKENVEKYQPYVPTEDDLKKLQELFENKYGFGTQEQKVDELPNVTETVEEVVEEIPQVENTEVLPIETIEPTPTPSEPIYFVDDEPILEEKPKINRLVYKKDE
jgi:hypothetical protein